MNKALTVTIIVLGLIILSLGISAFVAWLVSLGIAFIFDYHIGFVKTWVALFVLHLVINFVFSGVRVKGEK